MARVPSFAHLQEITYVELSRFPKKTPCRPATHRPGPRSVRHSPTAAAAPSPRATPDRLHCEHDGLDPFSPKGRDHRPRAEVIQASRRAEGSSGRVAASEAGVAGRSRF